MSKDVKDLDEQEDIQDELNEETPEIEEEKQNEKQSKTSKKEDKHSQIEEMGQKLTEINDKYLRLSAEFDNYRKRTLKEKADLIRSAGEQILEKILPVMDNFERALKSMENTNDIAAVRQGVELIYSNFKDFLAQSGVKEIECAEADFDPEIHEAVTKIPAPAPEMKGKIIDCIQKGYTLNDKVIRFPKVVVGE